MVYDPADTEFKHLVELNVEETPNLGATRFYRMLNLSQNPLWDIQ